MLIRYGKDCTARKILRTEESMGSCTGGDMVNARQGKSYSNRNTSRITEITLLKFTSKTFTVIYMSPPYQTVCRGKNQKINAKGLPRQFLEDGSGIFLYNFEKHLWKLDTDICSSYFTVCTVCTVCTYDEKMSTKNSLKTRYFDVFQSILLVFFSIYQNKTQI